MCDHPVDDGFVFYADVFFMRPFRRNRNLFVRRIQRDEIAKVSAVRRGLVCCSFELETDQVESIRQADVQAAIRSPFHAFGEARRQSHIPLTGRTAIHPVLRQSKIACDLLDGGGERGGQRLRWSRQIFGVPWNGGHSDNIDVSRCSVDYAEQVQGGSADYDDADSLVIGREQLSDRLQGVVYVVSIQQFGVRHGGIRLEWC